MENSLIKKSLIGLVIILSVLDIAIAEDSFSIPVSCSIPAVPGLNAPPFPEKSKTPDATAIVNQDTKIKDEATEQMPSTLQEDAEREIVLADGGTKTVITQTFYTR